MIYDKIEQLAMYNSVHPQIDDACAFLAEADPSQMKLDEKVPVGNDGAFVFLAKYHTRPEHECFIETHKRYIDVQVMLEGAENIGLVHLSDADVVSYDEEKDVQVLNGETQQISFKAGEFVIFFPQDGHMPVIKTGPEPESLKKLVFKLVV